MKRFLLLFLACLLLFSGCARGTVNAPDPAELPETVIAGDSASLVRGEEPATAATTVPVPSATAEEPATVPTTAGAATAKADATTVKAQPSTAAPTTVKSTQPTTAKPTHPTTVPKTTAKPAEPSTAAPKPTEKTVESSMEVRKSAVKPTEPATAAPKPTEPPTAANACTVRIECGTILNNLNKLKKGKADFVPESGVILADAAVTVEPGDTAFTVLRRACEQHVCTDNCRYCQSGGIQLEYVYTPGFETYYVEGIHQIYEKDCGVQSGWMFKGNGQFPMEGASSVSVKAGDRIVFCFTCDMGDDVGNHYEG